MHPAFVYLVKFTFDRIWCKMGSVFGRKDTNLRDLLIHTVSSPNRL
jgi:hypothetical protein